MSSRWWIAEPGQQPQGPFDLDALRQMSQQGRIGPATQVCAEGSQSWQPASSILGAAAPPTPFGVPAGYAAGSGAAAAGWSPASYVGPILATIFCCLIGGIVSIVYTAQANTKAAGGDIAGAMAAKRTASIWMWVSVAIGLVGTLLYAVLMVIGAAAQQGP